MRAASGHIIAAFVAALLFGGCMKWDYGSEEDFDASGSGLFILNEGNFQYGNATLSYYDPAARKVENEVFYRANAMRLGDVKGRITNLTSPRYIHFVSDTKAYVTQIWDNRIFIVDPSRYEVTGYIVCPDMNTESGSTEQMAQYGKYVYVNCWSYQNRILKIDTETDEVVGELTVGIQPNSLVKDRNGKLWTITDGGYEDSPYGHERPALYRIDAETFAVERKFEFPIDGSPSEIKINGAGDTLYWIDDDIWRMSVDDDRLPVRPFIESEGTKYYGLTVDAIDYRQQGAIIRYSADGEEIDRFRAGITPGAFCWK